MHPLGCPLLLTLIWKVGGLTEVLLIVLTDRKTPGRPVCSWSSSALLPVVREVDWTAGAACGSGTQSGAVRSKRTLQLFLDPTSFTATTSNNSKYVCVHYTAESRQYQWLKPLFANVVVCIVLQHCSHCIDLCILSGATPSGPSSILTAETPIQKGANALGNEAVSVIPCGLPSGIVLPAYQILVYATIGYNIYYVYMQVSKTLLTSPSTSTHWVEQQ